MKKEKSLETFLVLAGALIVLFWFFNKKIFLLLAIILICIGIVSPYLTEKISWLWLKLSQAIGFVMSRVILTVVFFVFLLPLAIAYRIFVKDALSLKKKNKTYYSERNHLYTNKDLENMW